MNIPTGALYATRGGVEFQAGSRGERAKDLSSNSSAEPAISTASVVIAGKDQVSCEFEGEAAILNLRDNIYYGLDDVGAVVWKLVQEPRQVNEILDLLLDQYDVDAERCTRDLLALLSKLAGLGLIEVRDGSSR